MPEQLHLFAPAVHLGLPFVLKEMQCFWVPLVTREYDEAMMSSAKRRARAIELCRKGKNKQAAQYLERDNRIGCLGERAYLVRYRLPFSMMDYYPFDLRARTGGRKPADFGNHDVKTKQHYGSHLLVQKDDPPEYVYVLASAAIGDRVVELCGWQRGEVLMHPDYYGDKKNTGRPCYWYPMDLLEPMSTLPPRHVAKVTR